jgi:HD-GYP domain-containing protein (c-di-GMP phosphodiesterase class II)
MAELLAALSLATDLGLGHPMEQSLRTCLLAIGLGQRLGLNNGELADVYYAALLRSAGCNAESSLEAKIAAGGDDVAWRARVALTENADTAASLRFVAGQLGRGLPPLRRAAVIGSQLPLLQQHKDQTLRAACEIGESVARRCGLSDGVQRALAQAYERWDGKGVPGGARADDIAVPARLVWVARHAEMYYRSGGVDAACAMVRSRAGHAYDPSIAEAFLRYGPSLLADLGEPDDSVYDIALGAEPCTPITVAATRLEVVAAAFADFVDLKAPYTRGHSAAVADLASAAAQRVGLGAAASRVRVAGYLHDLGRLSVPNGIWDKPGALAPADWERVRLYPYYTQRVLSMGGALRPIAELAGLHRERLDGSGYHRGLPAAMQPPEARVLAAADTYHALRQERPHRAALDARAAAATLNEEVRTGRLDPDAVQAVLEAAGEFATLPRRRAYPAGLTGREVEVLRLLARGRSSRSIAASLVLSEQTVNHHVRHIYTKIGVSTRAAAALYAMEHGLMGSVADEASEL